MGQLLVTTLPSSQFLENTIFLYNHQDPDDEKDVQHIPTKSAQENVDKQQQTIFLRNILLDVMLSLLTMDTNVLNTQWVIISLLYCLLTIYIVVANTLTTTSRKKINLHKRYTLL